MSQVVRLIVADDYDSAWISLYPAHQQVATRSEYVACEQKTPVGSTLRSINVVRVADRLLRIPGEPQRVPVKAVTLRITLADTLGTKSAFSHTFNAVPAGSTVGLDPDPEPLRALSHGRLRELIRALDPR